MQKELKYAILFSEAEKEVYMASRNEMFVVMRTKDCMYLSSSDNKVQSLAEAMLFKSYGTNVKVVTYENWQRYQWVKSLQIEMKEIFSKSKSKMKLFLNSLVRVKDR